MQRKISFDNGDYAPVSVTHGELFYMGQEQPDCMIVIGSAFCARETAKALLAYADNKERRAAQENTDADRSPWG